MIHELSPRNQEDFFEINCSSLPESLVESELFGYEKGAFTGALSSGKKGIFELANNSTLFLDEISELTLETQAKLLKVLETGKVLRIGGERYIDVNIRLVSATNANLLELVKIGKFRKDLYYRINVIQVEIPAIRNRKEDIEPLLAKFLNYYNCKYNLEKSFSKNVLEILINYSWPGNIREIKNLVEQMIIISKGKEIEYQDLPEHTQLNIVDKIETKEIEKFCKCCMEAYTKMPLKEATEKFQKEIIEQLLVKGNTRAKISELLKVDPSTITRKIAK